jgi:pantothenate kinase
MSTSSDIHCTLQPDSFISQGESLWIAVDIGGTLTKVLSIIPISIANEFTNLEDPSTPEISLTKLLEALSIARNLPVPKLSADLVVKTYAFCSREIQPLVTHLKAVILKSARLGRGIPRIRATGGGAVKYAKLLHEQLDVDIEKIEEMQSLVGGLDFCLSMDQSICRFDLKTKRLLPVDGFAVPSESTYPLLLVNIGSGVSMLKVDGPALFTRVSGTPLGGGTALGLGKLLIPECKSFDELIELSRMGDATKIDLSVGELVGSSGSLAPDTLAASLSKLMSKEQGRKGAGPEDIAQSIIRMISYNIGYIAYLVAKKYNLNRIFFSGKFVHKHEPTMEAIAYAVEFYGKTWGAGDKLEARFLSHEGYLGALGALLKH